MGLDMPQVMILAWGKYSRRTPAELEELPSNRPPGESSPASSSVGRELGRKRMTAYTSGCKVSPPRMLEAHRYCIDFSQHSSLVGKPLYRLHLNFRLEAPGGRLSISATHCDTKLH